MPHDIMHVLLEGVLPRHVKIILKHYIIDQHLFTIQYINRQIAEFAYGYSERATAPRAIDRDRLTSEDNKLVQSGMAEITFFMSDT